MSAAAQAKLQQQLAAASAHLKGHDIAVSDAALEAELAALMGDDSVPSGGTTMPEPTAAPEPVVPVGDLIDLGGLDDIGDVGEVKVTEADLHDPTLAVSHTRLGVRSVTRAKTEQAELAALTGGTTTDGPRYSRPPTLCLTRLYSVQDKLKQCEERLEEFEVGYLLVPSDTVPGGSGPFGENQKRSESQTVLFNEQGRSSS